MARTCKYKELNQKEMKCHNYFISHSKGEKYFCRISEWKKKKGVCPYDSDIYSQNIKVCKDMKNEEGGQRRLCLK